MTEEERALRLAAWTKAEAHLRKHLKPGDILTHTRCMGAIEEHAFTRWSEPSAKGYSWLCGTATADTKRFCRHAARQADDISPTNVTHVNRDAVDALDIIKEMTS